MDSSRIAGEIEGLSKLREKLLAELDECLERSVPELAGAVQRWIEGYMARRIQERAAMVQKLGVDRVRALKGDVAELVGRVPELANAELLQKNNWPHRASGTEVPPMAHRGSQEAFFPAAFRTLVSRLGPVLHTYGLARETGETYPEWQQAGTEWRYGINPGFDARKLPALVDYDLKRGELGRLMQDMKKKHDELDRAKAKELWDSA